MAVFREVYPNPALTSGREQVAPLQAAIDAVHAAGGGVVSIAPGDYSITTLFLRSGVELHLQRGARLLAHHNLADYPEVVEAALNKDQSPFHLLVARDCTGIAITGDGEIDGQDMAFWEACQRPEDRPYGIFRFTVRGGVRGRPSPLVQIVGCRRVRLCNFTIRAMPGWGLHVFACEGVQISGLVVRGHPYGPNTDGIGINGSQDVTITQCDVDTGDDAIILKATNHDSVCARVVVSNCVLASNCAAMGLGADVYGAIRDVVFTSCVVKRALRMIQVEMWFPGQVERAIFSGITGRTFPDAEIENERPIYVDIQQFLRPEATLGQVRDLLFRDIMCETRGRIMLTAQDGARIDGVTMDNVLLTVPEIENPEITVPRSTSWQLSNHSPQTRELRAGVVADNVDRLVLRGVEIRWPQKSTVSMHALALRGVTDLSDESPRLRSSEASMGRILEVTACHAHARQTMSL